MSSTQPTHETVTEVVRRTLPAAQGVGAVDVDADLGLGSLDLVALLLALEEGFGLRLPAHAMDRETFRSIRTITDALRVTGAAAGNGGI